MRCFLTSKRGQNVIVTILIFFGLVSNALGRVYYVDGNNGNDFETGNTPAQAWKTIQHAADVIESGDTVHVKEGNYNERIVFEHSGSSENKIVLIAEPKRSATINGGFSIDKDYIRVEGFRITSDVIDRSAIHISGAYVEVVDNYFFSVKGRAIYGDETIKPPGAYIADNHIYHSQMGIEVHGTDWLVENNEVERLFRYYDMDCDYARFFGENNMFRGNYFHGTIESEIGDAHVDCFQTWVENSTYFARYTTMENNICFDFHQAIMGEVGGRPDLTHTILFRNNIIAHSSFSWGGYGINNEGIPYVTVINNTFHDIRYRGVYITGGAQYAVVKNNIFSNCNTSYSFYDETSQSGFNLSYITPNNPDSNGNDLIDVNPLFFNSANDDFRLQSDSPACGAGENGDDMGALACTANIPPSADAGEDQTVSEAMNVILDGSGSEDTDGNIVSVTWAQIDGPDIPLTVMDFFRSRFTAPAAVSGGASLAFQLTVTDDGGLTDEDTCWVHVAPQDLPPTVSDTIPADNATDQAVDIQISATFSEKMDPSSLTTTTFFISDGTDMVPGVVFCSGSRASFAVTGNLSHDSEYTATITTGARDLSGKGLVFNHVWSFRTQAQDEHDGNGGSMCFVMTAREPEF
jgi:Bacterial Ig-like domain/K319L-like, PKD domain/Right handed beta helix region